MACKAESSLPSSIEPLDLFIAPITDDAKSVSFKLLSELRKSGISCDMAYGDRGLKGAMKAADKSGAIYALVIGDDEISSGKCELKIMSTGQVISSTLNASDLISKLGTTK